MTGEEEFDQRDEVEDHAQAGGVQRDAAEKITGAAERKKGVDQSYKVARQREAQPKESHRLGKYQSPLSLMQVGPETPGETVLSSHYIPRITFRTAIGPK
jgi:hypothetical protein